MTFEEQAVALLRDLQTRIIRVESKVSAMMQAQGVPIIKPQPAIDRIKLQTQRKEAA